MRSLTVRQLLTDVDFIEAVFDDYFYTTDSLLIGGDCDED